MPYHNYTRTPNIQGQGFYNPYMKGPDYGQGMRELMNNLWQVQLYKQEQEKLQQKETEERHRWERQQKRLEESAKVDIEYKKFLMNKEPTKTQWQHESELADQWYQKGIITDEEYKQVKINGKLPESLETFRNKEKIKAEIKQKYTTPKTTKPPISQPSLVTKLRQRARDVVRRQIQKAGGDISTLTGDTPMEVLMALMQKQAGGTSTAASQIAQKVDNMTGQFEILLSDREMTQEEKRGVQKYLQFISQIDKYEPQIEAMLKIPNTTIEEVILYFIERVIK